MAVRHVRRTRAAHKAKSAHVRDLLCSLGAPGWPPLSARTATLLVCSRTAGPAEAASAILSARPEPVEGPLVLSQFWTSLQMVSLETEQPRADLGTEGRWERVKAANHSPSVGRIRPEAEAATGLGRSASQRRETRRSAVCAGRERVERMRRARWGAGEVLPQSRCRK